MPEASELSGPPSGPHSTSKHGLRSATDRSLRGVGSADSDHDPAVCINKTLMYPAGCGLSFFVQSNVQAKITLFVPLLCQLEAVALKCKVDEQFSVNKVRQQRSASFEE